VRYLTSLVTPDGGVRRSPVAAIALHADPAADQALEQLTAASAPESVRRDAGWGMPADDAASRFSAACFARIPATRCVSSRFSP
jgi:hypothetical protein